MFWWSVRSGQFDDLEGPAHRIIMDRDAKPDSENRDKKPKDVSFPD
ncbi:MAG: cbb3-type cytochrome oxidase assembly protein CcoS [Fluviibacter sp.]